MYKQKYLKYLDKYQKLIKMHDGTDDSDETDNPTHQISLSDNNTNNYHQYRTKISEKVFNLSEDQQFGKNVQKNVKKMVKKYGKLFKIRSDELDLTIDVIVEHIPIPSGSSVYLLSYYSDKSTTYLKPFSIQFSDSMTGELGNVSYIANIKKTDTISGTQIVKLCLQINKVLGVTKTNLNDGSSIDCNGVYRSLALIKLLEQKKTFYMKLGFKFDLSTCRNIFIRHNRLSDLYSTLNKIIDRIRKIKTTDIIKEVENTLSMMINVLKEDNKKNLQIVKIDVYPTVYTYHDNPSDMIIRTVNECVRLLPILIHNKHHKYFYQLLVDLFKNNCNQYLDLTSYFYYAGIYKYIYGKNVIVREYTQDIQGLNMYIYTYQFCYKFD